MNFGITCGLKHTVTGCKMNLIEYNKTEITNIFESGYINDSEEYDQVENSIIEKDLEGAELLVSIGNSYGYEEEMLVIYEKDGRLYIVEASHCSCYDFSGQWSPSEYSYKAMLMRKWCNGCKEELHLLAGERLATKASKLDIEENLIEDGWIRKLKAGDKVWSIDLNKEIEVVADYEKNEKTYLWYDGSVKMSCLDPYFKKYEWYMDKNGRNSSGFLKIKPMILIVEGEK